MARYDVFAGRVEGSYLLEVQSELLEGREELKKLPFDSAQGA